MQRTALLVCSFWVAVGVVATGCATAQAAPATYIRLNSVGQVAEVKATPIIDELIALLPDATASAGTDACLDCHRDAEQLQLLAEEEDVPEVPSEGSG